MAAPQRPHSAPASHTPVAPTGHPSKVDRSGPPAPKRVLSAEQVAAIRAVMQIFVEDDLAGGMPADRQLLCDACAVEQPAPGFIKYDQHLVCNNCALEYEIARAEGVVPSAGEWVRLQGKRGRRRRPALMRIV